MNKLKIITIGGSYSGFKNTNFYSLDSLTDYDIVIIDPSHVLSNAPRVTHTHTSIYSIEGEYVYEFKKIEKQRKAEMQSLLKNGKMIINFLFPPFTINYHVYDGPSGNVSNYFWFDSGNLAPLTHLMEGHGKGLKPYIIGNNKHLFSNYYRSFRDELFFNAYLNMEPTDLKTEEVFITNSTNQIVGFSLNVDNGLVVFLPYFDKTSENNEKFVGIINHIAKEYFGKHVQTEEPTWIKEYTVPGIDNLNDAKKEIQRQIDEYEIKKTHIQDGINHLNNFRGLLFEKGKILEELIVESFKLIGFGAETVAGENTDFDVILKSEEGRAIAEVEGRDDDAIKKDKIDQLLSAINQDAEATGEFAKGILIGNPFRLSKPLERKEPFTTAVINLAKNYNYALVTTIDLFNLVIYLLEHNDDEEYKKACREKLFITSGELVIFPESEKIQKQN